MKQRTAIEGRSLVFAAVLAIAGLLASSVQAEEASSKVQGHRFWAELDLGYGHVERSASSQTLSDDSFALDVMGGLSVSPTVKVGLDLGGYNLQSTCVSTPSHLCSPSESERGKGLEHLLIVADFRPASDGWLLHGGFGASGYWAQSVSQYYNRANSYGWGGEIGVGYTWRAGSATHVGVRVGYEFGHLSGNESAGIPAFDYSALKMTLALAYY